MFLTETLLFIRNFPQFKDDLNAHKANCHLYPGGCSPHSDHVLGAGGEGGTEQPQYLGQEVHGRVWQLEQSQALQGGAESEQENSTDQMVAKIFKHFGIDRVLEDATFE